MSEVKKPQKKFAADPLCKVEGEGAIGAMRHVLANSREHDTTGLHRMYRKQLAKLGPMKFAESIKSLMEVLPDSNKPAPVQEEAIDLGTDTATQVLDKLLAECNGEADAI